MYLKLTLRNARRSALDYLLYIFTLVALMAIMSFSNCVSDFAYGIGFQAVALPVLIVIIMSVLVNFVNVYMMKQRANEFATYMLLGIEKRKLAFMFLGELMLIGLICYLIGTIIGAVFFAAYFIGYLSGDISNYLFEIIIKGSFQSLIYFILMEMISMLLVKRKIFHLQIIGLMREKRLNHSLRVEKKRLYGVILSIGVAIYLILLFGIFSKNSKVSMLSIGFVMVPLLICVFAFFKWLYCQFGTARLMNSDFLYSGNRLYWIADMISNSNVSSNLNSIFCISMLFSAMSFIAGELMLMSGINIFVEQIQQYMGLLQISICIIFFVIYFSIFSLTQIMQLKKETRNADLLFCMGKTRGKIKGLICSKALVKLLFPALISFVIIGTVAPFANYKLNLILPAVSNNLILRAIGKFAACFAALYVCYYIIVYVYISKAISKERR